MCLGIPGKVVRIKGDMAFVDHGPKTVECNNMLVGARVGDYVLVSSRNIVQTISEEDALRRLSTWKEAL